MGEIPHAILQNEFSRAEELAKEYVEIFGRENFFLEIQNHGLEEEEIVRAGLKKISQDLNINLVATNDLHYVNRSDSEVHDILLCIQMNKIISDKKRLRFDSDDYYLKSAEEMAELFADFPDALENTNKIAERCNVTFEFGKLQLPEFPLPENYSTEQEFLRDLCYKKLPERFEVVTEEIKSRLEYELKIIHAMGYDGYFLIVWDFINFARQKKIPTGPGRGSAAGSIVAYILHITNLNPLAHNLLFERFLNPERISMPDIDIDFCFVRREEVIDYVKNFYGADKVAQIATFGTMAAKAAVRDVVRVLNIGYSTGTEIVEKIPAELNITLSAALEKSKQLRALYESDSTVKKVIDLAQRLEGIPRHFSVHAAGIVISKLPLTDFVPVQISNNMLVTQYDKDKVEELGLLKMDFLGLRTLTIIDEAVANIKKSRGIELDIEKIPLRDEVTAKLLSTGQTSAVFQMESEGMIKLICKLKPENFFDLIPTVALYRPGPLGSGMVEQFIGAKHGTKKVTYLHPKLEPILQETFGVILYQEQVMQIVQALAGFTLGQADILRRAMGKKKPELLHAQKENFMQGCAKNGIDKTVAEKIFDLLEKFADYGFNKSHSAAYALLAWQTAYLKAHYPAEYMAAMMSSVMDNDKVSVYAEMTRSLGIEVLPPDINLSGVHFQVEVERLKGEKVESDNHSNFSPFHLSTCPPPKIRFAMSAIRNVGEIAISRVVEVRERDGKFKSLTDFCRRVHLNDFTKRALENLIKAGCFDSISKSRTALLESLDDAFHEGYKSRRDLESGQVGLFGEVEQENNFELPLIPERPKSEILAWEKEALGFYLTSHPLDAFADKIKNLISLQKIKSKIFENGKRVKVGGIIADAKRLTTKRGDMMAFARLEDFTDSIKLTIFPQVFQNCMNSIVPEEIVIVSGKVEISSDAVQILADKVIAVEDYQPDIYLTITAQVDFNKLTAIFDRHAGGSAIFLKQLGRWKKLTDKKISYSLELGKELKNLLGAENVKIY